jgi:hypothetical protein
MAEPTTADLPAATADQWGPWQARIKAARTRREDKVGDWQRNVDRRKVATTARSGDTPTHINTAESRVTVPKDWAKTKAKIANLYSATPEVRLTPRSEMFAPAVEPFGRELNSTISDCSVGNTIEEVLADVVNASGIGAVIVSCAKRTIEKLVDKYDPMIVQLTGIPQEQIPVTDVADLKYLVDRISPADLLIPSDFTGSNYNKAKWLGYDGRMTWAQAKNQLGLTDDQKDDVIGEDKRAKGSSADSLNTDTSAFKDSEVVEFTELFAWKHYYDPEEKNFSALQRLVFVHGLEDEGPAIVEDYQVQKRMEDGRIVGVKMNPIQVITLTYISDENLPPSDSTVARFQIEELEASRSAQVQQRKHSTPFRWGDSNRIGNAARAKLDAGNFQDIIWVNGPGERAMGEVSRASYPQERWEFDAVMDRDLNDIFQVGENQAGNFAKGERSAREAGIIDKQFQRRVGQEQDKVQRFFLGIVEVLAGHLALYGTFDLPDEVGQMRQEMANAFLYSTRVDSTVRQDADERIEKLTRGLNLTAQSGYVNPKPIIAEIWELLGVDPSKVVIDPQPKAPEPVKVSIGSAEDIINPVMLGALMRTGQAPGPEDIAAAVKLLQAAMAGGVPLIPPSPTPDGPQGETEKPKGSNMDWEAAPRIERRADDGGA